MGLLDRIEAFFKDNDLALKSGIVVACSTGVDSMVLLHFLQQLETKIVVAHVNHNTRQSCEEEEQFCREYCEKHHLHLEVLQLNTSTKPPQDNFQDWARKQRYAFFNSVASQHGCAYIATAHHATDKAETFVMHALRGSGLSGLTSLKPVNGNRIRPMHTFTKDDILGFATSENLSWFEDESNSSDDYMRNRVRHHVLPTFQRADAKWSSGLANTVNTLDLERNLLQSLVKGWESRNVRHEHDGIFISLPALQEQKAPKALLWYLLKEVDPTLPIDHLAIAQHDQTGSVYLGQTHTALRERDWLIIKRKTETAKEESEHHIYADDMRISHPLNITFDQQPKPTLFNPKDLHLDRHSAILDFDRLSFPLTMRKWSEGDKFRPLGMKGFKKISDFLIDEKVSRFDKENVHVLISNEDIAWVIGHRIDDRFKVGKDTQIMYLGRLHNTSV